LRLEARKFTAGSKRLTVMCDGFKAVKRGIERLWVGDFLAGLSGARIEAGLVSARGKQKCQHRYGHCGSAHLD
jgi:hypothetical protein